MGEITKKFYTETFKVSTQDAKDALIKKKKFNNIETGYATVLSKIHFKGFSSDEENTIKDALEHLYYGSKSARYTFNKGTLFTKKDITIEKLDDCNAASSSKNTIYIDPDNHYTDDSLFYITKNNVSVVFSHERILMHEATHLIHQSSDDYSTKYPAGPTVDRTNIAMQELGTEAPLRDIYKETRGYSDCSEIDISSLYTRSNLASSEGIITVDESEIEGFNQQHRD